MSPAPNSIPFEPDIEKKRENKFTMLKPSERNRILTDANLHKDNKGQVEDLKIRYIQVVTKYGETKGAKKLY